MTTTYIDNPCLMIKPSKSLFKLITELHTEEDDSAPLGISNFTAKDNSISSKRKAIDHVYLLKEEDHAFMNSLDVKSEDVSLPVTALDVAKDDKLLTIEDLRWIYKKIEDTNASSERKIYFHEVFEGSELILPENVEIPRNPELEKRCKKLKAQNQNRLYKAMTKNVDNVRQRYPEDTISYQMKQLNKHLIAVGQFILSVIAGFAFGFIGIELLVGRLDFGFRLLLGIICGLTVALAELYFLAKQLNEDIAFTAKTEEMNKTSKMN